MTLRSAVKRGAAALLGRRLFGPLRAALTRGRGAILMYHRFGDGPGLMAPALFESHLRQLRDGEYQLLPLLELVTRLRVAPASLERAVSITIDDGYADVESVAAPLLQAYRCPATVFLVTGFLDGQLWLWWDQVAWLVDRAPAGEIRLPVSGGERTWAVPGVGGRRAVAGSIIEALKLVPDPDRRGSIAELARQSGTVVPSVPPSGLEPLSWEAVRRLEEAGLRFGPHTVTHPILSRMDDAGAEAETRLSWDRLRQELRQPEPVFCYPNGLRSDFSAREVTLLRAIGIQAAVATEPGYARPGHDPFALPRFAAPRHPADLSAVVSGLDGLVHSGL
jgi:peptidoglycan/xylan/chitin deacetylase (PgdA/CDA1 family)